MQIELNDHRKIHAIQEEFNTRFPFLKIEFFSKPNKVNADLHNRKITPGSKTLGECSLLHKKGKVSISQGMTVAELEEHFRDAFGLEIQIFRKSGTLWLATRQTENWSLEKQNMEGEAITRQLSA
jgi:hypothetical protein